MTSAPPPRPSPGVLWQQAHGETTALPSWERGEKCRARYRELLTEHGHLLRTEPNPNGRQPDVLPWHYPAGRRVAP